MRLYVMIETVEKSPIERALSMPDPLALNAVLPVFNNSTLGVKWTLGGRLWRGFWGEYRPGRLHRVLAHVVLFALFVPAFVFRGRLMPEGIVGGRVFFV